MITISSFLRLPGGKFVPVDATSVAPPDPDYIEGAIELQIDGVEIIGKREWDYVDQLWAYISSMMKSLASAPVAETYFPDQPILLKFRRNGPQILVSSEVGDVTRQANADHVEFIAALRTAGTDFFTRMSELVPANADVYQIALSEIAG
jgi:hypothetical protein